MFFHWFGNKRGAGFVQLACANIGRSVVSVEEREALAYLSLRVALECFLFVRSGMVEGGCLVVGWFVCF